MSIIAIGDIHGESQCLADLLSQVVPEMRSEDTLVFLGDYIDRGPDSRGCVEKILQLQSTAPFSVVTLLGNHEQWMLRSLNAPRRHSWLLGMEAFPTIESYSSEAAGQLRLEVERLGLRLFGDDREALPYHLFFGAVPEAHLRFFQELKAYCHVEGVTCAHGGIDLDGSLETIDIDTCVWGPLGFPEDYYGTDTVVYGHRNNAVIDSAGIHPCIGANRTYGIDTISHGVLTGMRFPDGKIFQSSCKASKRANVPPAT